ncbi:MAG TPA: hypothetical protein DCL21_01825 [Alphaproteobacteria bacterium]|nr:hypothetical protein [Alphaproteobacteria bacterium]
MQNDQNSLFSTKGFYLGVAIFTLGLMLMIMRVAMDLSSYKKEPEKTVKQSTISIDQNIQLLQEKLDKKILEQETTVKVEFDESIQEGALKIYDHNPIKNKQGIITAVEFIDFGCSSCLVDANFAHRILKDNVNVKLISKLNNVEPEKSLHIANIASLVAAKENKFFEFREKQLTTASNNLNDIINNLEKSGVSLRSFRRAITVSTDAILHNLAKDIAQAEHLDVTSYAIFINNRMFSDNPKSKYNLKDITVYLNNL